MNERVVICFDVEVEDETEVTAAEKEMDEVDDALHQSPRKYDVRRKHSTVGSRLTKKLNKYKMKLDFRCNGMCVYIRCCSTCPSYVDVI